MNKFSKTKSIIIFLIIFFGFFGLAKISWAANWYVRPATGDCAYNGDGTASTCAASAGATGAWKGFPNVTVFGTPNSTYNGAGHTLYLVSGLTYIGESADLHVDGAAGNPFTITVYGEGTATIDTNKTTGAFYFNSHKYITIDGVKGNAVAGDYDYGLKITNLSDESNCQDYSKMAFYSTGGANNLVIKHVDISGSHTSSACGTDKCGGFRFTGTNTGTFEITYNWIHTPNCSASMPKVDYLMVSGMFIDFSGSGTSLTTNKIHHNLIECVGHDAMDIDNNVSVYNNILRYSGGNPACGAHNDGIVQNGNYAAIYNNYIEDFSQAVYLPRDDSSVADTLYFFNNVINNPGHNWCMEFGESGGGHWNNIHIYNNSFINGSISGNGLIWAGSPHTNFRIKNNLFYLTTGEQVQFGGTFYDVNSYDYNCYHSGSSAAPDVASMSGISYTLAELQGLTPPRETHGSYGAVVLNNYAGGDYTLSGSDTICLNKGVNLSSLCTAIPALCNDKNGITRPQGSAWDIGADEYVSGVPPDTTPPAAPMGVTVN